MDAVTIKKLEQMARAAEMQSREAMNRSILVEAELRSEIDSLKEQIASLEKQLANQKERPTLRDKCDALVEILSNCYQSGEKIDWDDWSEIRKQYAPNDDPDLAEVKEFFLKGQGRDLYRAVVNKPASPDSKPTPAPMPVPPAIAPTAPAPLPEVAPTAPAPTTAPTAPTAPAPKKNRLKGRVSTEPTITLVDDPDNLAPAPIEFAAPPSPAPTFDSPSESPTDITASLEEIASAGRLGALPNESLGRLSNFLRSALTGVSAPTVRDTMEQVGQVSGIPLADKKRIVHFLMEGAAPTALQQALLESSSFVLECFSTLFF